jgi:16S rRNA (cytosine1402-N4)-methyltransferase
MRAQKRLFPFKHKCLFGKGSFADIDAILHDCGIASVNGILLDLGISLHQLKMSQRGFSFKLNGTLDMRMDRDQDITASELVNRLSKEELAHILRDYGEEKWASLIAQRIVQRRAIAPITTTLDLADLVFSTIPRRSHPRNTHPATRTFQALRIAVNDELNHLQKGMEKCISSLAPGGRIVVISFHSLEHRIVKDSFRQHSRDCICPPRIPECRCSHRADLRTLTRRPIVPTPDEIERNPLARSAQLRGAEKLYH